MSAIPRSPAIPGEVLVLRGSDGLRAPAARLEDLPGPRPLPLVGNVRQFEPGAMHRTVERWAAEYGPIYRMSIGPTQFAVVSDPVLIGEILRHRPHAFARGRKLADTIEELLPRGLFTAEGDDWKRQRRLVMRALTPEAIRGFFPVILAVTGRLRAKWLAAADAGVAVDVARDLKRYSVDVATWLSMDVDVNTLEHPENPLQSDIEFWFETVGRRFRAPLPYWRWLKLPADRRADETMARLRGTIESLVAAARARLQAEPERRARPRNVLEALCVARDEPDSEFTDADVAGNVGTMLFAGEDTAANAMAWLMLLLATNDAPRGRAVAELDALLGERSLVDAFGDLARLPYLEAAAVESMRLKPIAPQNGATALVEVDLAGLRLKPDDRLMLLARPSALSPERFPDPERFDPDRWLGAHGERADDPKRAIFPFGGGPRYCPGRYLAMVELKMVLGMALKGLRFELDPGAPGVVEHLTFTMGPQALPMRFARR
jgi:cytochrome P450